MRYECGGCENVGRHRRWCPWVVGPLASILGQCAEQAEALGDRIGANSPGAANMAYALSAELRQDAKTRSAEYMTKQGTSH